MRKKLLIIIPAALLLIIVAVVCTASVIYRNSPYYALTQIMKDVNENGISGLEGHLTGSAEKTYDTVEKIADNKLVGLLGLALSKSDRVTGFIDKLKDMKWDVDKVVILGKKANVTLSFALEDSFDGTVEMEMEKTDGEWKISSFSLPDFTS